MKKAKRIVVWFRKDLRLHDNQALTEALQNGEEIVPIYVFNPTELIELTDIGYPKTGRHRAQFLLESVAALRADVQRLGIDLVIRFGKPEEEVFELVKATEATWVYANMERTLNEVKVQNALEKNLWSIGAEIQFFRGKMLYYTQDLPFPISHSPDTYSSFRKEVGRFVPIRTPLGVPTDIPKWTITIATGQLPTLEALGHSQVKKKVQGILDFKGGEAKGLAQLECFLGESQLIEDYQTHQQEIQLDSPTSHLSPWLALGCLSPKHVYTELVTYENQHKKNKATQEFMQALLTRDYLRLMGKKYGDSIFEKGGIIGRETKDLEENRVVLQDWIEAKTEEPLINALMKQLSTTGYLPPKGRYLVASYLINDLQVDWRMGAAYFQHILIDYDICSNWVNWNIAGGVGPDPKEEKQLSIENQQKKLDADSEYRNYWGESSLEEA